MTLPKPPAPPGTAIGQKRHKMIYPPSGLLNAPNGGTIRVYERFVDGPSSARRVTASDRDPEHQPLAMVTAGKHLLGAAHPHDLDDRVPGLSALRNLALGDSRITIVILDGNPDLTLSSLRSDRISKVFPYWHERAVPITVEQHALYRKIANSDLPREQKGAKFLAAFSPQILFRFLGDRHATHITSIIAGQCGTPAPGIAPDCQVIVVPLNEAGNPGEFISPLNLARAFDLAHDLGADIIHCAACSPTQTDAPPELLARAVRRCLGDNILIVAPAGNNAGDCRCIPAVLPGTIAVGALKDNGKPFKFSNWGGNYSADGIMAPGERILGAQPGTEEPIREMGTSVAAPVVTGVAALLMARQLQIGRQIDAAAIRTALLNTARACDSDVVDEPERCLRGVMNLPAAFDTLFASRGGIGAAGIADCPVGHAETVLQTSGVVSVVAASGGETPSSSSAYPSAAQAPISVREAASAAVEQSTAYSGLVYAIGGLSYDFGSEIGRQEFEQYMAREAGHGDPDRPTPHEVGHLIEYLDRNPTERDCLIWTLAIDGAPVYGLIPQGPYEDAMYAIFLQLLAGQYMARDQADFVERISIPGRRTGEMIRLYSRAELPILNVTNVRGIYGWKINALVSEAVNRIYGADATPASISLHNALTYFLNRIYFELHNLGQMSRDRAMNFAATNLFQAASVFARAIDEGRVLDTINVKKSPICRLHSDCWDLSLTFFDPENEKRAAKIFQFTIDVSDMMPVTVGDVKSWFQRRSLGH
jgi:subtilisin family serine protease